MEFGVLNMYFFIFDYRPQYGTYAVLFLYDIMYIKACVPSIGDASQGLTTLTLF